MYDGGMLAGNIKPFDYQALLPHSDASNVCLEGPLTLVRFCFCVLFLPICLHSFPHFPFL